MFPSTPGVRIELEDLIGNTEDAFNCPPPLGTPGDHVHWQNGPTSSDVSASIAQPTQRSRKRARSSSPASSQLERSVHFDGPVVAADTNRPHKVLRTPNNDPTQELWKRYMNANGSRNADGDALPSFVQLPPSSPMTPSTGSKDSGLRRTVSCGVEWPASKPKRRRVEVGDSHGRTKDIFAASRREILARDMPKNSRVTILVEKIQESLARQARTDDEPSSSSPLPEKHSQMPPSQVSPTRSPSKLRSHLQQTAEHGDPDAPDPELGHTDGAVADDFDDDDLDLDFFEEIEKGFSQVSVSRRVSASINNFDGPQDIHQRPLSQAATRLPGVQPNKHPAQQPSSQVFEDNFDVFDEDDDTFTNEMENLVAKIDSQGKSIPHEPAQPPTEISDELPTIDGLDGVFDDGDDDDDNLLLQIADDLDHANPTAGTASQVCASRY